MKNEICRRYKKSKEEWMSENCKEIEQNMREGRFDAAYVEVKNYFSSKNM